MKKIVGISIGTLLIAAAFVVLAQAPQQPQQPASQEKATEEQPAQVEKKPETRTLHFKDQNYEMFLTVKPGIPQVGRVTEFFLNAQKIADPPHPQYGPRVPMEGATILANAAHESALNTSNDYKLHPSGDPGNFGFHFTPVQKGYYRLNFIGEFEDKKFEVSFRVPVDVWPLPASELKQEAKEPTVQYDAFGLKMQRRFGAGNAGAGTPVRRGPVIPGATATTQSGVPLAEMMAKLGAPWSELGDELLVRPAPNDQKTSAAIDELVGIIRQLHGSTPPNFPQDIAEYQQYMSELQNNVERLASTIEKEDYANARTSFRMIEKDNCMRCHAKFRFKLVDNLASYPKNLPGR